MTVTPIILNGTISPPPSTDDTSTPQVETSPFPPEFVPFQHFVDLHGWVKSDLLGQAPSNTLNKAQIDRLRQLLAEELNVLSSKEEELCCTSLQQLLAPYLGRFEIAEIELMEAIPWILGKEFYTKVWKVHHADCDPNLLTSLCKKPEKLTIRLKIDSTLQIYSLDVLLRTLFPLKEHADQLGQFSEEKLFLATFRTSDQREVTIIALMDNDQQQLPLFEEMPLPLKRFLNNSSSAITFTPNWQTVFDQITATTHTLDVSNEALERAAVGWVKGYGSPENMMQHLPKTTEEILSFLDRANEQCFNNVNARIALIFNICFFLEEEVANEVWKQISSSFDTKEEGLFTAMAKCLQNNTVSLSTLASLLQVFSLFSSLDISSRRHQETACIRISEKYTVFVPFDIDHSWKQLSAHFDKHGVASLKALIERLVGKNPRMREVDSPVVRNIGHSFFSSTDDLLRYVGYNLLLITQETADANLIKQFPKMLAYRQDPTVIDRATHTMPFITKITLEDIHQLDVITQAWMMGLAQTRDPTLCAYAYELWKGASKRQDRSEKLLDYIPKNTAYLEILSSLPASSQPQYFQKALEICRSEMTLEKAIFLATVTKNAISKSPSPPKGKRRNRNFFYKHKAELFEAITLILEHSGPETAQELLENFLKKAPMFDKDASDLWLSIFETMVESDPMLTLDLWVSHQHLFVNGRTPTVLRALIQKLPMLDSEEADPLILKIDEPNGMDPTDLALLRTRQLDFLLGLSFQNVENARSAIAVWKRMEPGSKEHFTTLVKKLIDNEESWQLEQACALLKTETPFPQEQTTLQEACMRTAYQIDFNKHRRLITDFFTATLPSHATDQNFAEFCVKLLQHFWSPKYPLSPMLRTKMSHHFLTLSSTLDDRTACTLLHLAHIHRIPTHPPRNILETRLKTASTLLEESQTHIPLARHILSTCLENDTPPPSCIGLTNQLLPHLSKDQKESTIQSVAHAFKNNVNVLTEWCRVFMQADRFAEAKILLNALPNEAGIVEKWELTRTQSELQFSVEFLKNHHQWVQTQDNYSQIVGEICHILLASTPPPIDSICELVSLYSISQPEIWQHLTTLKNSRSFHLKTWRLLRQVNPTNLPQTLVSTIWVNGIHACSNAEAQELLDSPDLLKAALEGASDTIDKLFTKWMENENVLEKELVAYQSLEGLLEPKQQVSLDFRLIERFGTSNHPKLIENACIRLKTSMERDVSAMRLTFFTRILSPLNSKATLEIGRHILELCNLIPSDTTKPNMIPLLKALAFYHPENPCSKEIYAQAVSFTLSLPFQGETFLEDLYQTVHSLTERGLLNEKQLVEGLNTKSSEKILQTIWEAFLSAQFSNEIVKHESTTKKDPIALFIRHFPKIANITSDVTKDFFILIAELAASEETRKWALFRVGIFLKLLARAQGAEKNVLVNIEGYETPGSLPLLKYNASVASNPSLYATYLTYMMTFLNELVDLQLDPAVMKRKNFWLMMNQMLGLANTLPSTQTSAACDLFEIFEDLTSYVSNEEAASIPDSEINTLFQEFCELVKQAPTNDDADWKALLEALIPITQKSTSKEIKFLIMMLTWWESLKPESVISASDFKRFSNTFVSQNDQEKEFETLMLFQQIIYYADYPEEQPNIHSGFTDFFEQLEDLFFETGGVIGLKAHFEKALQTIRLEYSFHAIGEHILNLLIEKSPNLLKERSVAIEDIRKRLGIVPKKKSHMGKTQLSLNELFQEALVETTTEVLGPHVIPLPEKALKEIRTLCENKKLSNHSLHAALTCFKENLHLFEGHPDAYLDTFNTIMQFFQKTDIFAIYKQMSWITWLTCGVLPPLVTTTGKFINANGTPKGQEAAKEICSVILKNAFKAYAEKKKKRQVPLVSSGSKKSSIAEYLCDFLKYAIMLHAFDHHFQDYFELLNQLMPIVLDRMALKREKFKEQDERMHGLIQYPLEKDYQKGLTQEQKEEMITLVAKAGNTWETLTKDQK